jgi:ADP-ribosylglycohydrolase
LTVCECILARIAGILSVIKATAIYAFLAHPNSFAEAVLYAVKLGGDTDTIGAMCGAIAGAYHGLDAIPNNWLNALENSTHGRDDALELASELAEKLHLSMIKYP